MSRSHRSFLTPLVALLFLVAQTQQARGYIRGRTDSGVALAWTTTTVNFVVNNQVTVGQFEALRLARRAINEVPTSRFKLEEFSQVALASPARNAGGSETVDGLNLITFVDNTVNNEIVGNTSTSHGSLALTLAFFSGTTGRIVEADIVVNPKIANRTAVGGVTLGFTNLDGQANEFDLPSVALHEMLHAAGADHSGVLTATMYQATGDREFLARTMHPDDVAYLTAAYPVTTAGATGTVASTIFGTASGRITRNSVNLPGAHVVFFDPDKDRMIGAISLKDGTFSIAGLPAGSYQVYAEPLDGPVERANLQFSGDYFGSTVDSQFQTTFLGANAAPTRLTVNAGTTLADVNINVPADNRTLNVTRLGRNFPDVSLGSFSIGTGPLAVLAGEGLQVGKPLSIAILGDGLHALAGLTNRLSVSIPGTGISIISTRQISFQGTGAPQGVAVEVLVQPNAPPGPRQVQVIDNTTGQVVVYTHGLEVRSRTLPKRRFLFPAVAATVARYTGIAASNNGADPSSFSMKAYRSNGELIYVPGNANPTSFALGKDQQTAKLAFEFFNWGNNEIADAWVEISSDSTSTNAFFLGGSSDFKLDGADVPTENASTDQIFTSIIDDPGLAVSTRLHVVNAGLEQTTVSLFYFAGGLVQTVTRSLKSYERLSSTFRDLFGFSASSGYVQVVSDKPVVAFEEVENNQQIVALNARPISQRSNALVSPHYAAGVAGTIDWKTDLNLTNTTSSAVNYTIQYTTDTASQIVRTGTIAANQTATIIVNESFLSGSSFGTVRVTADGPLLGNIIFGNKTATLASALPLTGTTTLLQNMIFSKLVTALGYFTGLAVFNPGTTDGTATITLYDGNGGLIGTSTLALPAGKRVINILEGFIAASANRTNGFIKVTTTVPSAAFVLFGTTNDKLLSAVPPTF
ncbi:MAG: hypothetical protein ACR2L2_01740 [Acidobacteriota bacterium]